MIDVPTRRGYASNKEAPFVSVVDLERGEFAGRIEVPGSEGIDVSPDGGYVFVAAPEADFGSAPAADVLSPAEAKSNTDVPGIRVIEVATGRIAETLRCENVVVPVHTTATGLILAGELRMGAGESALGSHANGALAVFEAGTHRLPGRVEAGGFPLTITSSPDGSVGYVANVQSSTVFVIDLERLAPITTLRIDRRGEPGAHGLAYLPA